MPNADLLEPEKTRWTLDERYKNIGDWTLSNDLYGADLDCDINDFEAHNYIYLLDNVKTRGDLVKGLRELSPLADDALVIAEHMTDKDFTRFKRALVYERRGTGKLPKKYHSLFIPKSFVLASLIADKFQVPLGVAAIRLIEYEEHKKNGSTDNTLF